METGPKPESPRPSLSADQWPGSSHSPVAGNSSPVPTPPPRRPTPLPDFDAGSWRPRFSYIIFALTLLPLAFSILGEKDDTKDRLIKSLAQHPEIEERLDKVSVESESQLWDIICRELPEHKIEGAMLERNTSAHWFLAILSFAVATVGVYLLFDKGEVKTWHLPGTALFTATFGMVFLTAAQFLAAIAPSIGLRAARFGKLGIILLFFYALAMMYHVADNPEYPLVVNLLGFTFGIGLLEEATKALPVWINLRSKSPLDDWRAACVWGLCSGIGFGIAEGIMYSASKYNGLMTGGVYAVRFISCVGLHAIWGGTVSIMLFRNAEVVEGDWEWIPWLVRMSWVIFPAMFLHGLYDTLLTRDQEILALLTAFASFGLFAFLIERCYWDQREAAI